MCRFVTYMGDDAIPLNELLGKPKNSLINQSREVIEGRLRLNADGFGLAWYKYGADKTPGVFKSIQPAWNDNNLKHLADKIKSDCFMGHVRASSVGDVVLNNCHPFVHDKYAFVHNGTIRHFHEIRRQIIDQLDDDMFNAIKAQTDSEHLFFLIMQYLHKSRDSVMANAVKKAFEYVVKLQKKQDESHASLLNIAMTSGTELFASRYASKGRTPLSLYYAFGQSVDKADDGRLLLKGEKNGALIVASEPLTDCAQEWHEVPANHYLVAGKNLNPCIEPF